MKEFKKKNHSIHQYKAEHEMILSPNHTKLTWNKLNKTQKLVSKSISHHQGMWLKKLECNLPNK